MSKSALSPDGSRLAVLRPDFGIDIWTSRGKSVLSRPNDGENREEQENRAINAFEFSPEGQYLALHSRDGHVTLVDSSTGTSIFTSSDTQYFPLMGSYESDDCARDFNWKGRNRLHFQTGTTAAEWEIVNNRNTDRSSSQFRVKTISDAAVDFGFDGRSVTSENGRVEVHWKRKGNEDVTTSVIVRDKVSDRIIGNLQGFKLVNDIRVSQDGKRFSVFGWRVTDGDDAYVYVYQSKGAHLLSRFNASKYGRSAAFIPNSTLIVLADSDGTRSGDVFDMVSGDLIHSFQGAFAQDGLHHYWASALSSRRAIFLAIDDAGTASFWNLDPKSSVIPGL